MGGESGAGYLLHCPQFHAPFFSTLPWSHDADFYDCIHRLPGPLASCWAQPIRGTGREVEGGRKVWLPIFWLTTGWPNPSSKGCSFWQMLIHTYPSLSILFSLWVPVTLPKCKGLGNREKPVEYLVDIIAPTTETPARTLIPPYQAKMWLTSCFLKLQWERGHDKILEYLLSPFPMSFCLFLFFWKGKRDGRESFLRHHPQIKV